MARDLTAMETHGDANRSGAAARERAARETEEPIEVRRFWEAADLSDACARLSPYRQEHFAISFDSFDDYTAWRNEQANPWNR
ncbi:MAG: hypothetical protein OXH69_16950 [Acidobacteria bacterium]|nr:hypothetical protein [Acidobacteriota bacterium]